MAQQVAIQLHGMGRMGYAPSGRHTSWSLWAMPRLVGGVMAWRWGLTASGSGPWAPWGKMGHAQTPRKIAQPQMHI